MKKYTFATVTPELWEEILNTANKMIEPLSKEHVPLEIVMQAIMLVIALTVLRVSASAGEDIETIIVKAGNSIITYSEFEGIWCNFMYSTCN